MNCNDFFFFSPYLTSTDRLEYWTNNLEFKLHQLYARTLDPFDVLHVCMRGHLRMALLVTLHIHT